MEHSVYGLKEPNQKIRYVGVTNDPKERLEQHLTSDLQTPVYIWIRDTLKRGVTPEMVILETCSESEREARESYWIILTGADLNIIGREQAAIGKTGAIPVRNMQVHVSILDAKASFGVPRYLITPVSGTGSQWVNADRVSILNQEVQS